jgi:hypothetical protein
MTNRETIKTRSLVGWASVTALPTRLMDQLWDKFHNHVVEGYQDEDGFHDGVKPAPIKSSWPPFA